MPGRDVTALRVELLNLLHVHPTHAWSTELLTAVLATIKVEIAANEVAQHVTGRRLHIV